MKLTSEQIQEILEGAVKNIMAREGCDRQTAMRAVEKNGVKVNVKVGEQTQTLVIRLSEKKPAFQQND